MTDKYILREVIQTSNEEKLTKVGINCLITIYRNSFRKAYK